MLAKTAHGLRERAAGELPEADFVPFTAQTRMSGVDLPDGRQIRKGAAAAVLAWVRENGGATRRPRSARIVDAHLHARRYAAGRGRAASTGSRRARSA